MRRSGLATTSGSAGTGPGNDTGVWLIITIILFALLCNYSRTICLIDVGTEGGSTDPFTVELTVSLSALRLSRESGDQLQLARICFRHEPDDASAFGSALHCEVETQSSWSGLALTREAWHLPLRRRDPLLRNWLERKAEQIIATQARQE